MSIMDPVILLSAAGMVFMFLMAGYMTWFAIKKSKKNPGEE